MTAHCIAAALYVLGASMTGLLVLVWARDNRPELLHTARTTFVAIAAMLIWPLIPFILLWMVCRDWDTENGAHE